MNNKLYLVDTTTTKKDREVIKERMKKRVDHLIKTAQRKAIQANDYYAKALDDFSHIKGRQAEEITIIIQTKFEEIQYSTGVYYYDKALEMVDFLLDNVKEEHGKPVRWKFGKEKYFRERATKESKEIDSLPVKLWKYFFC
ncbi:hypothetical protein [Pseudobacillus badius]|uniref:hypothetical protein n=1 Tax=Bacillus badius TaxID=1455 RepID=UPI003D338671